MSIGVSCGAFGVTLSVIEVTKLGRKTTAVKDNEDEAGSTNGEGRSTVDYSWVARVPSEGKYVSECLKLIDVALWVS